MDGFSLLFAGTVLYLFGLAYSAASSPYSPAPLWRVTVGTIAMVGAIGLFVAGTLQAIL